MNTEPQTQTHTIHKKTRRESNDILIEPLLSSPATPIRRSNGQEEEQEREREKNA